MPTMMQKSRAAATCPSFRQYQHRNSPSFHQPCSSTTASPSICSPTSNSSGFVVNNPSAASSTRSRTTSSTTMIGGGGVIVADNVADNRKMIYQQQHHQYHHHDDQQSDRDRDFDRFFNSTTTTATTNTSKYGSSPPVTAASFLHHHNQHQQQYSYKYSIISSSMQLQQQQQQQQQSGDNRRKIIMSSATGGGGSSATTTTTNPIAIGSSSNSKIAASAAGGNNNGRNFNAAAGSVSSASSCSSSLSSSFTSQFEDISLNYLTPPSSDTNSNVSLANEMSDDYYSMMKREIDSAVDYLTYLLIKAQFGLEASEAFRRSLTILLVDRYVGHWYPEEPLRGSGYRCLRVNGVMHPLLANAADLCSLHPSKFRRAFPAEFTLWIDPGNVNVRIGEDGSIGSFSAPDGNSSTLDHQSNGWISPFSYHVGSNNGFGSSFCSATGLSEGSYHLIPKNTPASSNSKLNEQKTTPIHHHQNQQRRFSAGRTRLFQHQKYANESATLSEEQMEESSKVSCRFASSPFKNLRGAAAAEQQQHKASSPIVGFRIEDHQGFVGGRGADVSSSSSATVADYELCDNVHLGRSAAAKVDELVVENNNNNNNNKAEPSSSSNARKSAVYRSGSIIPPQVITVTA